MKPNHQNFFASPAQGSTLNASQFGAIFAQHACRGYAPKNEHAYDAQTPQRPQRSLRHLLASFRPGTRR